MRWIPYPGDTSRLHKEGIRTLSFSKWLPSPSEYNSLNRINISTYNFVSIRRWRRWFCRNVCYVWRAKSELPVNYLCACKAKSITPSISKVRFVRSRSDVIKESPSFTSLRESDSLHISRRLNFTSPFRQRSEVAKERTIKGKAARSIASHVTIHYEGRNERKSG